MKGPSERVKYDLHRVWECPVCKRRERSTGAASFRHCSCQMKQLEGRPVVMKLVVDGVQRVGPPIMITHEPQTSLELNVSESASTGVPSEAVEMRTEQSPASSDSPPLADVPTD